MSNPETFGDPKAGFPRGAPAQPWRRKRFECFKEAASIAANVATVLAVGGLIFSFLEYHDSLEEGRIARSLDLVETWSERKLDEDYAVLFAVIDENVKSMPAGAVAAYETETEEIRRRMLANIGAVVLENDTLDSEYRLRVDRLFDFFRRVAICVEETICARRPIDAFLLPYAADMMLYFDAYLANRRRNDMAFANEVERLVGNANSSKTSGSALVDRLAN
jgi:hypothetical protein